jgi:hypothetical protein
MRSPGVARDGSEVVWPRTDKPAANTITAMRAGEPHLVSPRSRAQHNHLASTAQLAGDPRSGLVLGTLLRVELVTAIGLAKLALLLALRTAGLATSANAAAPHDRHQPYPDQRGARRWYIVTQSHIVAAHQR